MTPQDYYRQQSAISDPGRYSVLFDALPDDLASICRAVQNVIVHYFANGFKPPKERLAEVDTRYVAAILERVLALDERPLLHERPPARRFIGCCRDFTLLTMAILRHKGIPARARYGTATYFERGYHIDHVVVEMWQGERWVRVDSQLAPAPHWRFNIRDVPPTHFHVGAWAWQQAHENTLDPRRVGLGSQSTAGGWDFILTESLLDLAALNQQEMLCWECWGMSMKRYHELNTEDKALLDEIARVTQQPDALADWQRLFAHPLLRRPNPIYSFSPAVSPEQYPLPVMLNA